MSLRVTFAAPVRRLIESRVGRDARHAWAVRFQPRTNYTFTRFLRLPHQLELLAGDVIDLLEPSVGNRELVMVSIGCSSGAQAYSIASMLYDRRPELRYSLTGYDIDRGVVARAVAGTYTAKEVLADPVPAQWFIDRTFDIDGEHYRVKDHLRTNLRFAWGDLFDPQLVEKVGTADIVFCQNLLVNLPVRLARRGFGNLLKLMRPSSALFVDGVPLALRERLSRKAGLTPLPTRLLQIHHEVRRLHGKSWPWHCFGVEPFDPNRAHALHRYATIFLQGEAARRALSPTAPRPLLPIGG